MQDSLKTPASQGFQGNPGSRRVCIAPMLDWTDRHYRYFARLLSRHTWLYTEMVTTGALIHGDVPRHLTFHEAEHPIALQLGGSEPAELAQCARLAESWGYDEVNLNVGCPSERVQKGAFGACLMKEPGLVADCVRAMRDVTTLPVTVKHRIGVDDVESFGFVSDFVGEVAAAGCSIFIVHARNAILKGLSPKENREIPPLKYDYAWRLKAEFPDLEILVNGGIRTLDEAAEQLGHVDGVMIGREAYHNPYLLAGVDARFYGDEHPVPTRAEVIERLIPYVDAHLAAGGKVRDIARHVLGLVNGVPGARRFRQMLSDSRLLKDADSRLFLTALTDLGDDFP
ncbi:tRNA dihydrouridine(20/20a) synthase DusA [Laribacter hongkongensis]|uniref:tRNA dihydrouridine(20/20a) synthase DusA n=1 Tax=Laribacter hongkongensis TaxID=168471 RepID=UPI0023D813EC|nr:tRNA dihydrouridine(20/20a) synthase DusA [Laribacter hongkongensis]MCG8991779.1 tRNA dihydrouridine(20/20a) synthase DusA [Laribacter hongkongensis]MCG8998704.1 tRNA dihydrouridine(20/20a) synthase DusA [Laribacter hongkongensis]MCG9000222.1 tRNA dihydrouridine(20/20a) synthase DusA [Laribacter hongkongensis]MCG9004421.1 tRNA dihydrouridine(20/20a) synthase DusA [Laribacter hongkongensis]MCG9006612.1 tRNA dihydrouridine(20/20a) synthase DusA [Laribacter hongkongensis]